MKKIILDTNFIVYAVQAKIDFIEELTNLGFKIIIPEEVLRELNKIKNSKQKLKSKDAAELALKILKKNPYEKIELGKGHVDTKIKSFAKDKSDYFIATNDSAMRKSLKLKNRIVVIRNKKRLEIV